MSGKMKKLRLNSQVRRAFRGRSRGFSLIEVSIAIALIGIVVVGILSALSYASMVLIIADREATAESLARSQIEYVKNQDYIPAENGGIASYDEIPGTSIPVGYFIWSENRTPGGYIPSVVGVPWSSGNNTDVYEDNGLQKITVVVRYEIVRPGNKRVEEQYTVAGYKRQPVDYTEV